MTRAPHRRIRARRRAGAGLMAVAGTWMIIGAFVALLGVAHPAGAETPATVTLLSVAPGEEGTDLQYLASGDVDPVDVRVEVDGEEVPVRSVTSGADLEPLDLMVVLDNTLTNTNAVVESAKQAATALAPGGRIGRTGLVTVGDVAQVALPLTSDAERFEARLGAIRPHGQRTSLWDGVALAGRELAGRGGDAPTALVVISAARDTISTATPTDARNMLLDLDVSVLWGLTLPGGVPFFDLAATSRAVARPVAQDSDLGAAVGRVSDEIAKLTYVRIDTPDAADRILPLHLEVGGVEVDSAISPGRTLIGAEMLAPVAAPDGLAGLVDRLLGSLLAKILIILLVVVAVAGIVFAAVSFVTPDESALKYHLQAYDDVFAERSEPEEETGAESVASLAVFRRAVQITGDFAEKRGTLAKVEAALERAEWPLRPNEALFFWGAGAVVAGLLGAVITGGPMGGLLVMLICLLLPPAVINFQVGRRCKAFNAQLPDMLQLLAGTLRAGYSIGQGFETVSQEIDDPMGRELRRVVTEARLGRPLDEALEAVAQRMDSDDFSWAVMAIRIQREVGGNLAELLLTVAETMTQRERLRRDVSTLTAEGRVSAFVLGMLPPGLGVVLYVVNPTYIQPLFEPGLGLVMIGAAVLLMAVGFLWMKKAITVEV